MGVVKRAVRALWTLPEEKLTATRGRSGPQVPFRRTGGSLSLRQSLPCGGRGVAQEPPGQPHEGADVSHYDAGGD